MSCSEFATRSVLARIASSAGKRSGIITVMQPAARKAAGRAKWPEMGQAIARSRAGSIERHELPAGGDLVGRSIESQRMRIAHIVGKVVERYLHGA